MRESLTERKSGIASVAEGEPRRERYASINELNADYIDHLVTAARARMKLRDTTQREAVATMDSFDNRYKTEFRTFWKSQNIDVDPIAADAAWQKVRKEAVNAFARIMAAPEPPTR